mmetsp:Transcript_82173/g.206728  ORF Transcript_82173/g.206728 Transcript_82173/m.206728 type:complete len:208 (+) Transcript_82173:206-829(+)
MVVVRAMAWAEVGAVIARIWLRNATQVRANPDHDEPLRFLAALGVRRRLAHRGRNRIVLLGCLDHVRSALADEHGLAAPLHHEVLSLAHWAEVDLDDARCPDVLRGPHGVHELAGHGTHEGGHDEARGGGQEVDPWPAVRVADRQAVRAEVEGALGDRRGGMRRILCPPDRAEVLRGELGDGRDCGLVGVMPNIRANDLRTGRQLAL